MSNCWKLSIGGVCTKENYDYEQAQAIMKNLQEFFHVHDVGIVLISGVNFNQSNISYA